MRIGVLKAGFDPISQTELRYALQMRKQLALDRVILVPAAEGILPLKQRLQLVRQAAAPYRKLQAAASLPRLMKAELVQLTDASGAAEEAAIRSGSFFLAAVGTRRTLVDHGCYLNDIAKAHCTPHRYRHVLAMSQVAAELAACHGVDPDLAYRAGMMHDITKRMSEEEGRQILTWFDPAMLQLSPNVWHSATAVWWLRRNLGLRDQKILHAIGHHTLGDGRSSLDEILYIADKIDPTRGYDATAEMSLSRKSLTQGARLVKEEVRKYLKEKEGIDV